MTTNETGQSKKGIKINIDSAKTPVLYTDSVFVTSNKFGYVLNFAQSTGPSNDQTVVSRVGMSKEHAKALLDVLANQIQKPNLKGKTNPLIS